MQLKENQLAHYGILRKSGRYPWGSGDTPLQRSETFLDLANDLHKKGMSQAQIAKAFSPVDDEGNIIKEHQVTVADLRALRSRATTYQTQERIRTAQRLKDKGMGYSEVAREMGVNESTVRSLLEPGRLDKLNVLQQTADMLKRQVEEKEFLDVGAFVEGNLPIGDNPETKIGISKDKFKTALSMLKEEGYNVHSVFLPQVGTGEFTQYKVLCKPGVTRKEAFANRHNIRLISEKSDDRGRTWSNLGIQTPLNIDLNRVGIKYKEDGGADADGVIYVRPGVKDIELGKSKYAQVRIAVDGTHYLKGMAVYKDDLPAGVDLMFHTNKPNTGDKLDVLKPLKVDKATGEIDKENPFGAAIKLGGQILDKNGKVSSAMNIINEEGDWDKWSKNISSQVLSKQSPELAKSQLDFTFEKRQKEFDKIKGLTNPKIKQTLLHTFSEETDSAAVHLKAASMPRQATKVILPSNHIKPTEIFAPTHRDGERVALVRYPHAGTFEIPELIVNNRSREAKKLLGMGKGGIAPDAVLIHPKVAEHLSGADFDGDHVVLIPNDHKLIRNRPPLEGLKGFDPQHYKVPLGPKTEEFPKGTPIITPARKQSEMGIVTNLISDMTIRGASTDELARAVRHSMVVIDSEKHNLDFKASERQNDIRSLKRRYQGVHEKSGQPKGASTLITKAASETHPFARKPRPAAEGGPIDKKTGAKVFVDTGRRKRDGTLATFKTEKLAEETDAFALVSEGKGTRMEQVYAEHSNRLKAMANEARREMVHTELTKYSPSAKATYSHEVASLNSKLRDAELNAPLERQAQVVANKIVAQMRQANPDMQKDEVRKIRGQALAEARLRTGAKKHRVQVNDREWEAIQAGAISNDKLESILKNSDLDAIRKRATPRENPVMTPTMTTRAKNMLASGYTPAEVADKLGVAVSTLKSSIE